MAAEGEHDEWTSMYPEFAETAKKVNAIFMVDMAHIAGLVAAGLHQNPCEYADVVTSTTHKTLRGPRGGLILCKEEYAKAIDKSVFPGNQGGPLMHIIASKAVCFGEALKPEFQQYQARIVENSAALASALVNKGVSLVSGGTDNHLMLVNLNNMNITGKDAEAALSKSGIIANKNTVPFETRSPFITSGVRLGTPACTTRGMKETEMELIADYIETAITNSENEKILSETSDKVRELCSRFPVY